MDDPVAAPPLSPSTPLWKNRDYMLLWSGQAVSLLGSGVSQIAFPLLVLWLSNSPAAAGIAVALFAFPYLVLSLPAGALVDRWDRKRTMIVCDSVRALSLASVPVVFALGHLTVIQLYINATVEGSLFVFFNLSETAALTRVVPKENLPTATAQNEGGQILGTLISPGLGGFLYSTLGKSFPFLVDAISYGASVVSLSLIRTRFQEERAPSAARDLRQEIAEGVSWLWHNPLIRYMAFLTGALNFAGNAEQLLLILMARAQHAPAVAIGLMFSIGSVGGLAGAIVAPRVQRRFAFGRVIQANVWVQAVLVPVFLLAPNPFLLGVILMGLFVNSPIYNAVQFAYRISIIPDRLQGRVNSAFRMLSYGLMPFGPAAAGFMAQVGGPRPAIAVFAICQVALAVLTTLNPHVRHARPVIAAAVSDRGS